MTDAEFKKAWAEYRKQVSRAEAVGALVSRGLSSSFAERAADGKWRTKTLRHRTRDALLDIASAQKLVEVAHSSVELANEALSEAQQRYANGVSDNLGVSQAQQSVAQAENQYVASLYRHNVAKLSLARAVGAAGDYTKYLGQAK